MLIGVLLSTKLARGTSNDPSVLALRHTILCDWLSIGTPNSSLTPLAASVSRPDLSSDDLATAKWPLARSPYLLETSRPGIFAVGDVRGANVKRVASAVGEGSIAVAFVHQVLRQ